MTFPVILFSFLPAIRMEHKSHKEDKNGTTTKIETYHYTAQSAGSRGTKQEKSVEIKFVHSNNQLLLNMKSVSQKNVETVKLVLEQGGKFISGTRRIVNQSGKLKFESSMWRKEQTGHEYVDVKRSSGKGWKTKRYRLPKDKPLAVGGSLLVLLRCFPFDKNQEWKIFMVDWSQRSVTVTVRQAGVEKIRVKAGSFECYRMEVIVTVFIFRHKIIYWLSKETPHFLVKHRGMTGPFSRIYVTRLVSIENDIKEK